MSVVVGSIFARPRPTERVPIECGRNPHNESYLTTKADKLGHLLQLPSEAKRRG